MLILVLFLLGLSRIWLVEEVEAELLLEEQQQSVDQMVNMTVTSSDPVVETNTSSLVGRNESNAVLN